MINILLTSFILINNFIISFESIEKEIQFDIQYNRTTKLYRLNASNDSKKDINVQIQAYGFVKNNWIIVDNDLDHREPMTNKIGDCGVVLKKFHKLSKDYEIDAVAKYLIKRSDKNLTTTKIYFKIIDCRNPMKVYYESHKLEFNVE